MDCPNCGKAVEQWRKDCPFCSVVFAKFRARSAQGEPASPPAADSGAWQPERKDSSQPTSGSASTGGLLAGASSPKQLNVLKGAGLCVAFLALWLSGAYDRAGGPEVGRREKRLERLAEADRADKKALKNPHSFQRAFSGLFAGNDATRRQERRELERDLKRLRSEHAWETAGTVVVAVLALVILAYRFLTRAA